MCVCGQLQTRTYEGQDGTKRYATEVVADDVEFIGPRQNAAGDGETASAPVRTANKKVSELQPVETEEDDFPF